MENEGHLYTWIVNAVSASAIVGAFLGVLPLIAAGVAAVWYGIQIYESNTTKTWLHARRLRKIAKLQAQIEVLSRQLLPPKSTPPQ